MIPYANMAPFQAMGPPAGCEFVECLPKDSIRALREKSVLAAAVPVGGLPFLEDAVEPLGPFGIACHACSMSVLLFTDRPMEQFRAPLTIGLTGESASSIRLLYLLLGYQHGFDALPLLASPDRSSNGYLVIGDRALTWAREFNQTGRCGRYTHVTDLADKWFQYCGLPFVFARWVVRHDAPSGFKSLLVKWLQRFGRQETTLIEQSVDQVAERLDLPADHVARYLKLIRRRLTAEDDAGQALFQKELILHGVKELFKRET